METQLPPPPPPPQPRKTGLIIGIVGGVLLLLCLCIAVISGVITFRDQIPGISSLFATPTPEGLPYANADLGIQLTYPYDWYVYDGEIGIVIIATSQAAVEADTLAPADAFAVIIREPDINAGMYSGVDMTSAESMLYGLVSQGMSGLTDATELDQQTGLTIGGYPAALSIYSYLGDDFRQLNYLAVIISGDLPTTVLFTTSEEYLSTYRPMFDSILYSLTFDD